MGGLTPGASYDYRREGGVTTAVDQSTGEETIIGWDYKLNGPLDDLADHNLWVQIRLAGKKNPALQTAIDNVKIMYHLSKDNGTK
jgi:hypothetical protein